MASKFIIPDGFTKEDKGTLDYNDAVVTRLVDELGKAVGGYIDDNAFNDGEMYLYSIKRSLNILLLRQK